MSEVRKICITGAWYSSKNAGDQAILITISDLIKKYIPNAKFTVFSSNPEFVTQEHGFESFSPRRQPWNILLALKKADILIIGGGTPFYDDLIHMLYFTLLVLIAKAFHTSIMIYAVSTRRLETRLGKFFTKHIFNQADLITIRELETVLRIRALGVKKEIHQMPDPAITLTPVESQALDEILAREGLTDLKKPTIGICLRNFSITGPFRVHHYEQFSEGEIKNYKNVMVRIADYLATIGEVIFIPMNTVVPDDDRVIAQEIVSMMKNAPAVRPVNRQYRPRELIGLFSKLDVVIGSRLHSLVLASAVNTPVIGISYGHKTKGFMVSIGQEKYSFDLESLEFRDLQAKVEDVLSNRASIKEHLRSRVENLKKLALTNAELAAKLCMT